MVRMYLLDGTMLSSRETMHDHLYMCFALPEYYGRNLDALHDCLSEKEPGVIVIRHAERADRDCLLPLMGLLLDLVNEDPAWEVNLSTGDPDCHAHGAAPEAGCAGDCAHCGEPCAKKPASVGDTPDEAPDAQAKAKEEATQEDGESRVKAFFKNLFA